MTNFTTKQMMAVAVARQIKDGQICIVGTGLPLIAASLAKNTTAPNVTLMFESGVFDGFPGELPTSVGDIRLHCTSGWQQFRYIGFVTRSLKSNKIDVGFLGGAQIDPYGNLNSTVIGDYFNPTTRLPGSGGGNGIATYCDTILMMKHEKQRFVEKIDYMTSPGWIDGPDGRAKRGLPPNKGPRAVITELGIMRFDDLTKRMYLAEYYPGITPRQVQDNTGFELDLSRAMESEPPTEEIITILTNKIDPQRLMV